MFSDFKILNICFLNPVLMYKIYQPWEDIIFKRYFHSGKKESANNCYIENHVSPP